MFSVILTRLIDPYAYDWNVSWTQWNYKKWEPTAVFILLGPNDKKILM